MSAITIEDVTPEEFWRHGYRTGWDDHAAGRTHLLDDPSTGADANVIDMRRWLAARGVTQ